MKIDEISKARAFADSIEEHSPVAAAWIISLAGELEAAEGLIVTIRTTAQVALSERTRLTAERDAAVAAMQEMHGQVSAMLREANHLVANHPDPAASAAAMRILKEGPSDEDR